MKKIEKKQKTRSAEKEIIKFAVFVTQNIQDLL